MTKPSAADAVEKIIADLCDRRGWSLEWGYTLKEMQEQITEKWTSIVQTALDQARAEGLEMAAKRVDDIATTWAQMPISDCYREIARSIRGLRTFTLQGGENG